MLFQPFVYKKELLLYASSSAGRVWTIRHAGIDVAANLAKGPNASDWHKFEALKTKYLAIYPNYFFTAETGAMVQGILYQLQDINFFTVRKQLDGLDITIADLLELNAFFREQAGAEDAGSLPG